jgi:hypothetical protein
VLCIFEAAQGEAGDDVFVSVPYFENKVVVERVVEVAADMEDVFDFQAA